MTPPMTAVDIIASIVEIAVSTSDLITTITDVVISGVNLFAGFARMIIQIALMGMQAVSAVFNAVGFALLITLFATTIGILNNIICDNNWYFNSNIATVCGRYRKSYTMWWEGI